MAARVPPKFKGSPRYRLGDHKIAFAVHKIGTAAWFARNVAAKLTNEAAATSSQPATVLLTAPVPDLPQTPPAAPLAGPGQLALPAASGSMPLSYLLDSVSGRSVRLMPWAATAPAVPVPRRGPVRR